MIELLILSSLGYWLGYGLYLKKSKNIRTLALSLQILQILLFDLGLLLVYYYLQFAYSQHFILSWLTAFYNPYFLINTPAPSVFYLFKAALLLLVIFYLGSLYWQLTVRQYWLYKRNIYYTVKLPNIQQKGFRQTKLNASIKDYLFFSKTVSYEYYLLLFCAIVLLYYLITASSLISFYLAFEILSVITYGLMSFWKTKQSIEAVLRYYFYGFLSSILIVWGCSLVYTALDTIDYQFFLSQNITTQVPIYAGLLIILGFVIKLGLFPYHSWVYPVYHNLTNSLFLFMLTVFNTGLILGLLSLLKGLEPLFSVTYIQNILGLGSLLTITCGACLLLAQTTVQGFLIANSLVNTGFVVLGCISLLNVNDQPNLLLLIVVYLLAYNSAFYTLFNSWSAVQLWHQFFFSPITLTNNLITKKNWIYLIFWVIVLISISFLGFLASWVIILKKVSITIAIFELYIKVNKFSKPVNKAMLVYKTIWKYSKGYNNVFYIKTNYLQYFTNLKYYIGNFTSDFIIYPFFWVMLGLPPFLLFLLKFYLMFYILSANLLFYGLLSFYIMNILVTLGLVRIMVLSLITIKYRRLPQL